MNPLAWHPGFAMRVDAAIAARLGESVRPRGIRAMGRRGVDDYRVRVAGEHDSFDGGRIGQAQERDIGGVNRLGASRRVLAEVVRQCDEVDAVTILQTLDDAQTGRSRAAVDEYVRHVVFPSLLFFARIYHYMRIIEQVYAIFMHITSIEMHIPRTVQDMEDAQRTRLLFPTRLDVCDQLRRGDEQIAQDVLARVAERNRHGLDAMPPMHFRHGPFGWVDDTHDADAGLIQHRHGSLRNLVSSPHHRLGAWSAAGRSQKPDGLKRRVHAGGTRSHHAERT